MSDFLLDLIFCSLCLYWVGLGPPIFVKFEVAANFELPNRHFATGRVWVMGSSKQVTFSINSGCQVSFWDLCIKALTFTSCLGQSRPPSSLGLFQYLQHLTFFAAISSKRCQCLMIFTAVAGPELQLKAQHFLHDAALQSLQWPRRTLHANHTVVVDHIRCSSRHHQCLSSMISDLIIQ